MDILSLSKQCPQWLICLTWDSLLKRINDIGHVWFNGWEIYENVINLVARLIWLTVGRIITGVNSSVFIFLWNNDGLILIFVDNQSLNILGILDTLLLLLVKLAFDLCVWFLYWVLFKGEYIGLLLT